MQLVRSEELQSVCDKALSREMVLFLWFHELQIPAVGQALRLCLHSQGAACASRPPATPFQAFMASSFNHGMGGCELCATYMYKSKHERCPA